LAAKPAKRPQCQACYKFVGVTAEPGASNPALQCRVCREPLTPTEGDNSLKYFLVSRPSAKSVDAGAALTLTACWIVAAYKCRNEAVFY
jgi:hypothetical protein